jgi:hypothetical protein
MGKIIEITSENGSWDSNDGFLCDLREFFAISAVKAFNRRVR